MARFGREAQILASLNHPNIGQIYGLEESGDSAALVLELIEGPTLDDLIATGPVPVAEAIGIAEQIARALEAAHERGIIHRDLKPSNVKVRPDGTVKVLDFGLAKAIEQGSGIGEQGTASASISPTITRAATMAGVILGTAAYMAPEQAAGKPADRRSDLWAFGVVLMEMLTGRQVFTGETVSHVLAAVLTAAPDWPSLPTDTPEPLRRVLRRCLEKDPRRRLESAADARLDLEDARSAPPAAPAIQPPSRSRAGIAWSVAALAVGALAVVVFTMGRRVPPAAPAEPIRFTVAPPPDSLLASASAGDAPPALSPDGKFMVFGTSKTTETVGLWLRRLDSLETKALPGTSGASWPFWSPDSRTIAFFVRGQLKAIDIDSGQVRNVCETEPTFARGGTWNQNGIILFAQAGRIMRVAAAGGEPSVLREPDAAQSEVDLRWPSFLPDGTQFLYSATVAGSQSSLLSVASIEGGNATYIRDVDANASYANGNILFAQGNGRLVAQPFDVTRLALAGEPRVLANDFARSTLTLTHSHFSASLTGVLENQPASLPQTELLMVDRRGNVTRTLADDGHTYLDPTLSPDHRYLAVDRFERATGDSKVWLLDLERHTSVPLSPGVIADAYPVWTRDGSAVMFSGPSSAAWGLYRRRVNSGAAPELLMSLPNMATYPTDISPDGKTMLYMTTVGANIFDIYALDLQSREATSLVAGAGQQDHARFSPDGKWMAYRSAESGRTEVYVESTGPDKARTVVSSGGGADPRWRADGRELYYILGTTVYAVSVLDASPIRFGTPVALFSNDRLGAYPAPTPNGWHCDVSPDGQSFVVDLIKKPSGQSPITVVVNWPSILEQ